jgi:hypothetical protein
MEDLESTGVFAKGVGLSPSLISLTITIQVQIMLHNFPELIFLYQSQYLEAYWPLKIRGV